MNAQVISSEPKEISLSITETDIGILYIIQHELLKASSTDFAGVIVKHPLTNECWMRVNSSSKPLGEIKKQQILPSKWLKSSINYSILKLR